MAVTGIIIPKGLKSNFNENIPGKLYLATDTNEIGIVNSNGDIIWDKWNIDSINAFKLYNDPDGIENGVSVKIESGVLKEYKVKDYQETELLWGLTEQEARNLFILMSEVNDLVGYDSYSMNVDYIPEDENDVVTRKYSTERSLPYIKRDGSSLIETGTNQNSIMNKEWLLGNLKEKLPKYNPCILGLSNTLYIKDNEVKVSENVCSVKFAIKVWNTSTPSISVNGGSIDIKDQGDGSYLVTSTDPITWFRVSSSSVSKVHLYNTETVTSMSQSFSGLTNLAEFTSEKESNTKNVTNFSETWRDCTSLTSFPQLDMSSGTNFDWAWYRCTSLPHCPAGNEVSIPAGVSNLYMCYGI